MGSGPGREDWLAGVRERMSAQRDELHDRPPFPVWGLSSPALEPFTLESYERDSGGWRSVTIRYGPAPPAGPSVSVSSAMRRGHRLPDLPALMQARWPAEPLTGTEQDTTLVVRGEQQPATVLRCGRVWATCLNVSLGGQLTVLGCDVLAESVWLVPVDDLTPYWRSRGPALPWPEGLDPHRALVERLLAERPGDVRRRHPLRWQRCVRAQQRISRADRRTAAATVRSMLEHVAALRAGAGWFADERLRQAAVEEILRYTGYREDVASRAAQLAWERGGADRDWELAWSRWLLAAS